MQDYRCLRRSKHRYDRRQFFSLDNLHSGLNATQAFEIAFIKCASITKNGDDMVLQGRFDV